MVLRSRLQRLHCLYNGLWLCFVRQDASDVAVRSSRVATGVPRRSVPRLCRVHGHRILWYGQLYQLSTLYRCGYSRDLLDSAMWSECGATVLLNICLALLIFSSLRHPVVRRRYQHRACERHDGAQNVPPGRKALALCAILMDVVTLFFQAATNSRISISGALGFFVLILLICSTGGRGVRLCSAAGAIGREAPFVARRAFWSKGCGDSRTQCQCRAAGS